VQVAAAEVDRGVLARVDREELTEFEREALDSVRVSEALPGHLRYRFRCTVCGDLFELHGDTYRGSGGWTRQAKATS
jgi:hypothetical protein